MALAAVIGAACQPAKPAPQPSFFPGQFVGYYEAVDNCGGGTATRSTVPFTHATSCDPSGSVSQAVLPDGSVRLEANVATIAASSRFTTGPMRLGDLQSLQLQLGPGSNAFVVVIFDVEGDGDFFHWDGSGNQTGFGADKQATCATPFTSAVTIDDSTACQFTINSANNQTIAQLKAGAEGGIAANTLVQVVVGAGGAASAQATAVSLILNGFELLVP